MNQANNDDFDDRRTLGKVFVPILQFSHPTLKASIALKPLLSRLSELARFHLSKLIVPHLRASYSATFAASPICNRAGASSCSRMLQSLATLSARHRVPGPIVVLRLSYSRAHLLN